MKHLKMLGLAVIAALGLMAFVGAGSASATTLFTNSNLTSPYPTGTEIHATLTPGAGGGAGTAILTGENGETLVTCSESTVSGDTTNETGTTVFGHITKITFDGCTTTVDTIALGELSIEKTGTNEGKVVGAGSQVTVNIFGVSCTYGTGTGTNLGTMTGGEAPKLSIKAVGLTKTAGGFLCPSKTGWDAEYTVTSPHAVYIGA